MAEFDFPVRFIADEYFILELLKNKQIATKTILKLNHIHTNSKDYSMTHNLMPDEAFKNSIKDKEIRGHALLGAFHPEAWPEFVLSEKTFESKLIKYAINIVTKKPYRIVILTSTEHIKDYLNNEHYSNGSVKSAIQIVAGENASRIIDIVSEF